MDQPRYTGLFIGRDIALINNRRLRIFGSGGLEASEGLEVQKASDSIGETHSQVAYC